MLETQNIKTNLILAILYSIILISCSIKLLSCINLEKALKLYPNYHQTLLKISKNLTPSERTDLSYELNNKSESVQHKNIIVEIPTQNIMVIYSKSNLEDKDIIKAISYAPSLEFKKATKNNNNWESTNISNLDIKKAEITKISNGQLAIEIEFNKEGKEKFANLTKSIINQPLGIFYNGTLLSAPIIREEILGGRAIISSGENAFTYNEVKNIVTALNTHSLNYEPIKYKNKNRIIIALMSILIIFSFTGIGFLISSTIKKRIAEDKCPNCGYKNKHRQKFCTKCGNKL